MLTHTHDKYRGVLTIAQNLYRQDPDWVTFFREVLGIDGIVRKAFKSPEEMAQFETSEEHDQIQKMLTKLRERRGVSEKQTEPTHVITVRIPKSMHEALISEAKTKSTSMNKLCISKLLQVVDEELIPTPPPKSKRLKQAAAMKKLAAAAEPSRNGAPPTTARSEEKKKSAEEDL